MEITDDQRQGLGVALNEATLFGVEVDAKRRVAALTFSVLALPDTGPPPDDSRIQFLLTPVGRVIASLRHGRWDNPTAPVEPFELDGMLSVVQSFGGLPIYGWEFIDTPLQNVDGYPDRLSLDVVLGEDGMSHSLRVFQDTSERFLNVQIWFDDLLIRDPKGASISPDEFIAAGVRWWDGLYVGDPRTSGAGIFPIGTKSD
jgi:hypothetical protein